MFQSLLHGMGRLLAYFYALIPNYGLAIIMLTVVVRVAMIPLAIKQAHSMQANRGNAEKMRKLAPEVKKLREKYKDDRQKQYEEQKKLYETHDVNMLGGLSGCLPMLLQAPIFLAMYAVLRGCTRIFAQECEPGFHIPDSSPLHDAIVDRTATFLGANLELRPSEVFGELGLGASWPYLVLVAVMGISMWYQTQMMMKLQPTPDPQMAQMQKVMKLMPLMLVVFSWNFPAGLILYWSASNVWTIGQQFLLNKKFGGPAPDSKGKGSGKGAPAKGGKPDPAAAKKVSPTKKGAPAKSSGGVAQPKGSSGGAKAKGPSERKEGAGKPGPGAGSARGGGSQRRAAARQARPSATLAKKGEGADPSAKDAEPRADGEGAAKAVPPGGRPKGSGARKRNKGGRR